MVVMLVLPTGLGKLVLGASWDPAQSLLLPAGLQILMIGLATGPTAALLGLREMNAVMALNVGNTIMVLAGAVVGAAVGGALGAMWLVAASRVVLVSTWIALALRMRRLTGAAVHEPDGGGAAVSEPPTILASAAPVPGDVVTPPA
jgi:hypothetical protein